MAKKEEKPDTKGGKGAEAAAGAASGGSEGEAKKGGGLGKLLPVVGVVVVLQAVITFAAISAFGPKKTRADVHATELVTEEHEEMVEIQVVDDRYQNLRSGETWLWDVSVFVQVSAEHQETVEGKLEVRKAEIEERVSRVFSRAEHVQLTDPDRKTINAQLVATFEDVFGKDAQTGESLVSKVLIPKCRGFKIEGQ